jgi:Fe-coproporphyrin III synthase
MCNTWQHPTTPSEEISPAVIDKLPAIPTVNITGGEPFLREDLEEILAVLKPKTKRVVISTNGYWTERVLKVARKHPWIGVRVSIEGLPKANDELRGLQDGFDHGIRTLTELHHAGVKDIGFGITLSDRNAQDLVELHHLSRMMRMEFATAAVHNSYYFHKTDNGFTRPDAAVAELRTLIGELLSGWRVKDWFRAYFNEGLVRYIQGKPRLLPCRMGHESFFLDPRGEIRPCNVMEETMGNLKTASFEEIWDGQRAAAVREKVCRCNRNCWMIGNAAEPMKRNVPSILKWIVGHRLGFSRGT